jgi:hypothetical protein
MSKRRRKCSITGISVVTSAVLPSLISGAHRMAITVDQHCQKHLSQVRLMILAVAVAAERLSAGALEVQTGCVWYHQVRVEVIHCRCVSDLWNEYHGWRANGVVERRQQAIIVWRLENSIRDPRMEAERLVWCPAGARPKGFLLLATASIPMAAAGDKRAMRRTLIT